MRGAKDNLEREMDLLIIKSNLQKLKLIQSKEEIIKDLLKKLKLYENA
jgi:hypothetical protein